ncbi:hypothetical protein Tco_1474254 [Tanacetum coccineum]
MQKTSSVTVSDNQYAVFNGCEYAILIFLNEYAVLDKKVGYAVSNGSGYAISGYRPEQHRYAVSSLMDTAYWLSEQ